MENIPFDRPKKPKGREKMEQKPILVYRGDFIESGHDLHIAVVNTEGELIAYYGDPNRLTFARSSMKPFQALPLVESGALEEYQLTERELSLFCASHIGEPYHRETVLEVLEKIGLTEDHLQCGTHIPRHAESYEKLVKQGGELTPVYSNCSGKHSGMLAGVVMQKMDVSTYREIEHPYQQQIIKVIAEISGYDQEKIGISVDGCGVPVHRMPLQKVALLYSRLAKAEEIKLGRKSLQEGLARIRDAMTYYPEMVAGTKQFDTDLMKAFRGRIVAKGGAEGVHCFGDRELGLGIAIKVGDGNARGTSVASMEVLKQLGIGSEKDWEKLKNYSKVPVLNARDETIGEIVPNFKLKFV